MIARKRLEGLFQEMDFFALKNKKETKKHYRILLLCVDSNRRPFFVVSVSFSA